MSALCHEPTYALQQICSLLDHLVGAREQRCRNIEAERFGSPDVDNQFELDRLLDGKVTCFCTLEDLIDHACSAAIEIGIAHAITEEAIRLDVLTRSAKRGYPLLSRKIADQLSMFLGNRSYSDKQPDETAPGNRFKSATDILLVAHVEQLGRDAQRASRLLRFLPLRRNDGVAHIVEKSDARYIGHCLFKQLYALAHEFGDEGTEPRHIAPWAREACNNAGVEWLADCGHDHRNGSGGVFGCERRRCSSRHNSIDLGSNQFGRKLRKTRRAAFNGSIFNDVALTLDVTELAQAIPERSEIGGVESRRDGLEHADAPQFLLLPVRAERPRGHAAANKDYELAPSHEVALGRGPII